MQHELKEDNVIKESAEHGGTHASTRMVEEGRQVRGRYPRLHSKINRAREREEGREKIL